MSYTVIKNQNVTITSTSCLILVSPCLFMRIFSPVRLKSRLQTDAENAYANSMEKINLPLLRYRLWSDGWG